MYALIRYIRHPLRRASPSPLSHSSRALGPPGIVTPLGQTLIVTAGSGLVQSWSKPIEKIQPGDVVWFQPGEKHWHGAALKTAMMHISIVEQAEGQAADWMEHVSDEQYQAGTTVE